MPQPPKFQTFRYINWDDLKEFLTANLTAKDCLGPFHGGHGEPRGADYIFMEFLRESRFFPIGMIHVQLSGTSKYMEEEYGPLLDFLREHFGDTLVFNSELSHHELHWTYGFKSTLCCEDY